MKPTETQRRAERCGQGVRTPFSLCLSLVQQLSSRFGEFEQLGQRITDGMHTAAIYAHNKVNEDRVIGANQKVKAD